MEILHLKNHEIDFMKWDKCIRNAYNGIFYAYSWYLNIVNEQWEALVYGDYQSVMPLTKGKKYGVKYLYQPIFTQQLGIFSVQKPDDTLLDSFIKALPYKFAEISFNTYNLLPENTPAEVKKNTTYALDLIKNYKDIYNKYSENTRRNLKKAKKEEISIFKGLSPNDVITFVSKHLVQKDKSLKKKHLHILRKIIAQSMRYRVGKLFGAYTKNNSLCAVAFFVTSHQKSVLLLSVSSETGREKRAMFLLIDRFITEHSEKNLTLDFEGSNIEGIARFYEGFGAAPYNYHSIRINNLAWCFKIFKP